jgi:hypothetical protein
MTINQKTTPKTYVENINLFQDKGHPLSNDLAGKAVRLEYNSGHTLEQHWQTEERVLWKGVEGTLAGYTQCEYYRVLKITEGIYFITWVEESTTSSTSASQAKGPWLTDVVLDFNNMVASASWIGPTEDGGIEYVLDQAVMTYIECDHSTECFQG